MSGPAVAFDGRRRATAVWSYDSGHVLMESDWTEGGGWTQARTLTVLGGADVSSPPSLVVDGRGDALMAWRANQQLRVSYRTAGGEWQQPTTLSRPGEAAYSPSIAIDDQGRSLILWTSSRPSSSPLYGYASRMEVVSRSRAGVWGKPKIICACASASALAMNASGHALVVWSRGSDGGLWAKMRSPSGRWSAAQLISLVGDRLAYLPLALNSRGGAVVAWLVPGPVGEGRLDVAISSPRGRFGEPQTIGDDPYWGFVVALAPTGEATVVWEDSVCGYSMSRLPGASSFRSHQNLGCDPSVPEALAMDAHGNALALWLKADNLYETGHIRLRAAERPAAGSFGTGADIGDMGLDSYKHVACRGNAQLAVTPDGSLALAVWLARPHETGGCTQVQATTLTR